MTQMAQMTQETQICNKCLKHADDGGADADFPYELFRLSKTRRRGCEDLSYKNCPLFSTVVVFDLFSAVLDPPWMPGSQVRLTPTTYYYILLSIWAWVLKIDHSTFFVYLWIACWNGWTYLRPTMIHPGCQGLNGVRLKVAPENNPEDPEPPIWPTVLKGRGMISRLNSTPGP